MALYDLRFKLSVAKDLRGIPKADVKRILARAASLRENPRPAGSRKLSGTERYRIRQGDYRILYTVDDKTVVVEVVKVGHRGDVYRDR